MDIGNKKSLLPFLFSGADIYRKNLLNRAFLFIGQASNNIPAPVIECVFLSENFMHLTGCQVSGNLSPTNFFELCLNRRLAPDMFDCLSEAFLKKDVLETVFSLPYSAKMMGMHSGVGNLLYTEKLAGTVRGCMGFVLGSSAPYLSPNTVLKEDIRNMVETSHKILAVYEKPRGAVLYPNRPVNTAKELRNKKLYWPDEIAQKIAATI